MQELKHYVGGAYVESKSGRTAEIVDPVTGRPYCTAPIAGPEDVDNALQVAATALGTISHSLTAIEALRTRKVDIRGIAFVGDAVEDSEATIADMGRVKRLGRLPMLDPLDPGALAAAFAAHFDLADFR